jgi:integrase
MTALAPTLQAFFTERLSRQLDASPHTIDSYRHAWRLLLRFASQRTGIKPADLDISSITAPLISDFLDDLEDRRKSTPATRNVRLAAIHSLFTFAAPLHPEHAHLIAQVLAIPAKRHDTPLISYLTDDEITALLTAPDRGNWTGRRDHLMLLILATTGLRVSELTALTNADVQLGVGAHLACQGKGRKERNTPILTAVATELAAWQRENPGPPDGILFPALGTRRRLSTDAVQHRLAKHVDTASRNCPGLTGKTITPHVLRHSCAMRLLHAGNDIAVIALWLGHQNPRSTRVYLHADLELKQRALDRTAPGATKRGRYKPGDRLLAFLEAL